MIMVVVILMRIKSVMFVMRIKSVMFVVRIFTMKFKLNYRGVLFNIKANTYLIAKSSS